MDNKMTGDFIKGDAAAVHADEKQMGHFRSSCCDLNCEGAPNSPMSNNILCAKHLSDYRIKNRRFERELIIDGILGQGKGREDITFEDCDFRNVKLTEIGCRSVRFVRCNIRGDLRIFKSRIHDIHFRSCSEVARIFLEESVRQDEGMTVRFLESYVGAFKIIDTDIGKLEFCDANSYCDKIEFVRGASVESLNISCPIGKLKIGRLPRISLAMEGRLELIQLEEVSRRLLIVYERDAAGDKSSRRLNDALRRYKSVVLAAYKSFEKRKMFPESDVCLFEIRRLGVRIKQASSPMAIRSLYVLERLIAEGCFGWGIRIINNVMTTFSVILLFSLVYFLKGHTGSAQSLGLGKCVEISCNRFFLIGADEFDFSFFPLFDSLESIMGVVLLTIITGVFVRKVVR